MSYYSTNNGTGSCESGKVCFNTKAEIISYIKCRNRRKGGDGFHYYRCRQCGYWHLTSHIVVGDAMLEKHAKKYNRLEKKRVDRVLTEFYDLAV